MAATRADVSRWFDEGVKEEAEFMIVACDTFDYDDYPVYVKQGGSVLNEVRRVRESSMQRVMEVYSLKSDKLTQLDEHRANHFTHF